MRIKEIADQFKISTRTIRFYEQMGLLQPSKHEQSRYRFFTEKEMWRLQTIITLREIGLSLKEIKTAMEHEEQGNQDELRYYLERQRAAMFIQWIDLRQNIEMADRMIELLAQNKKLASEDVYRETERFRKFRETRKKREAPLHFDQKAFRYDEIVRNPETQSAEAPNYDEALDLTVDWVAPKVGERGLDIGTGTGNLAGRFIDLGIRMSGIDMSKEMLKQCRRKFPLLDTKMGHFLAIPYMDEQFDFVVTSFAFHYLTEEQKRLALKEMIRVLKSDGRLCITDFMAVGEIGKQNSPLIELPEVQDREDHHKLLQWFTEDGFQWKYRQYNDRLYVVLAMLTD